MKKINLAAPAILAAMLSVAACSPKGDAGNNLTVSDVTLNDETAATENGFGNDADVLDSNAATPADPAVDNLTADTAGTAGNAL